MSLTTQVLERDGDLIIAMTGRIDRDAAAELESAYSAAHTHAAVELDFAAVEYINSTGIALIVGVLARARADGVRLRASGLTPHYRHIFEITRLSDFIEIAPSDEQPS